MLVICINDLKYYYNMRILKESGDISYCDLEVYISHLDKLRENFKIRFWDLDNMQVPEWPVIPFDMKIDNKGYESDLEDELIEIRVDFEAITLLKSRSLAEYCSNINIANKYPKLRAAAEQFLLAFPTSCIVEAGFSHVNAVLTKQMSRLNLVLAM